MTNTRDRAVSAVVGKLSRFYGQTVITPIDYDGIANSILNAIGFDDLHRTLAHYHSEAVTAGELCIQHEGVIERLFARGA